MVRTALASLVLATLCAAQQVPFPFKRSTILRKGKTTYFVEGRIKIRRGCEISVQKDVYIVGRGKDAVIEVEGSLQIHGVSTREVIISGVRIEPSKHCEDIHLDMVKFRAGGGLFAPKQLAARGKMFVENVLFEHGTFLDVAMESGRIDISSCAFQEPAKVEGLVAEGKKTSAFVVNIRGCVHPSNGFWGGVTIIGARDLTMRLCQMGGAKAYFLDCQKITFDGNKVQSSELIFEQRRNGWFSKTKLQKCDIYATKVIFKAPTGKKENVFIDKCWFKGLTRAKEIEARVIKLTETLRVKWGKINKRPLELAGALER